MVSPGLKRQIVQAEFQLAVDDVLHRADGEWQVRFHDKSKKFDAYELVADVLPGDDN